MKILIVHEVSYIKKVVYEYQEFAERLASRGHQVTVIDFDEDGDGKSNTVHVSRTGRGEIVLENIPFINLPVLKHISARHNYKKLLLKKLLNRDIDVVYLYSVFINGTNTVKLCKRFDVPVSYRILDIYHKIRKNKFISIPLYFGEKYIYKNCDEVFVTNERLGDYVKKMSHGRYKKMFVLHHGIDTSLFNKKDNKIDLRRKYGFDENDKIAAFLGTTYDFAGIDVVVKNFAVMRELVPDVKLLIIGGGDYDNELRRLIIERGLEKEVILTGLQPYSEVPDLLGIANIAFNSFQINDITKNIVPVKVVQYLACGKPVICTPLPDVVKLFPERDSGILYCDIKDGAKYVETIAGTLNNQPLMNELSDNAVNFVAKNFDMNNQILKLENELMQLCRK